MADDAAFENLKKEIRSVLLPFKEGCTLFMFRKEYKTLIGRAIPAEKFNFRDDIDLLQNIPDVVDIYQRGNEYILMAVADEATWHIQKMVANQKKSSKGKSSRSVPKYSHSSRYASRSSYAGSRQSSNASKPPARHAYAPASNTQSSGSRQPPAVNTNFSWTHTGTSNQTRVSNNTSFAVSNGQSSANRPSTIGSNGQSAVNRPTPIGANATPLRSSDPTSTNNTMSAVGNHTPVPNRQSAAASNPSHFVSDSSPAHAAQVVSNNSVANISSARYFSKQFQQDLPPRFRARSTTSSTTLLPPEVECKIVDVVRKYSTGLRMVDFFKAYQRNFNEEFSLGKHNFKSLQECLETIADLSLQPSTNNDFIIFYEGHRATQRLQQSNQPSGAGKSLQTIDSFGEPTTPFKKDTTAQEFKFNGAWANTSSGTHAQAQSHYTSANQIQSTFNPNLGPASFNFQEQSQTFEKPLYSNLAVPKPSPSEERKSRKSRADALDNFELNDLKVSSLGLTEQMKSKFREIISRNKQGIRAKDFPLAYESVTGSQFDLHTLGYTDLADLIDSMPDIMHRRKVDGSRNDWLVIPAHGYQDSGNNIVEGQPQKAALQIEYCIQNTRTILEAYSEGIPLNDFLSVYSINCNEPLYIVDLGFDNIENFLLSIKDRVPLMLKVEKGLKTIFLDKGKAESMLKEAELALQEVLPEAIPFDAASPDCEYKKLVLPLDFGTSQFVEVFTSEIISPGNIFIQIVGEETSKKLQQLSDELEEFYNGPNSEYYMVQDRHLKVGAMCTSKWPGDDLWYRARIVSVGTPGIVRVFYVDYGTSDNVSIADLRYLKETFSKLPAQAIRASLAYLKPPNRALVWNPEAKKRMLELCHDVSLMAKVEDKRDDVLYLILCDTRKGENNEIYLNDVLLNEGFAVSLYSPDPEPVSPQQPQIPMVDTQVIRKFLYHYMEKAISDLRLSYAGSPPNHLLSGSAAYQSSLESGAVQSAVGAMPHQMSAGIAAGQSGLGIANNHLIPGSSAYQSPSRLGAGQPSLGAMADQHQLQGQSMLGTMNYQPPSGIGAGQPLFNAMTNQLTSGIGAAQSMLGATSNQLFPGPYHSPLGFSGGLPSLGATACNMPPGFSASAGFNAGQLPESSMANQFPPGFGPNQSFASAASGYGSQAKSQANSSTDAESEFFEDGDEEFDEFLKRSVSKRYVNRIHTDDGYMFHILIVDEQLYVSSGDLSSLIWCLKEPDYLLTMLQSNDKIFESQFITEEGNETMFAQFEQFHVKGIQKGDETACLIIYPLHSTMRILNEYGHPSIDLRQHIVHEMESFDPNLPFWQELSEMEIPDQNEVLPAMSDEEKDNKRCLYELRLAKEGIRVKMNELRKIMVADPAKAQACQKEMAKHDYLNQRVELKIAQIQTVISEFAEYS